LSDAEAHAILQSSFAFIKFWRDFQKSLLSEGDNDEETDTNKMFAFASSVLTAMPSPVGFDQSEEGVVASVRLFCACVHVTVSYMNAI
jgi:hypothetical protein